MWGIEERGSKFNIESSLQSLGAVILENTSRYPGQGIGIKGLEERDAIRSKDLFVVELELSHSTDLKLPTPWWKTPEEDDFSRSRKDAYEAEQLPLAKREIVAARLKVIQLQIALSFNTSIEKKHLPIDKDSASRDTHSTEENQGRRRRWPVG